MIRRTILEWRKLPYGNDDKNAKVIPDKYASRLAAVAAASPLSGRNEGGILEHGRHALRARGVVGIIAANDCSLEILPKIDFPDDTEETAVGKIRHRLVHMLAVALNLSIDDGKITPMQWQSETILEIVIRLFAEKLTDAARKGLPRRYIASEEELPALRGRLDVTKQFTLLAANPSRLYCLYDELSPDIALNQIMKTAISRLSRISRSSHNQRMLRELAFIYADITDLPATSLRWDEVNLDRTNARWSELLNLANLLLGERFQATSTGESDGFSLLFEMNTLFEEYVARMIARALSNSPFRAVSQGGRLYCLETDTGGLFQTKPDILIKHGKTVVQVIDTKWKRIASQIDHKKQGVSQSDIYQMMAYGQIYGCSRLTLLYPHHRYLRDPEGLQSSNRITGAERWLETATLDVSSAARVKERLGTLVGPIQQQNIAM